MCLQFSVWRLLPAVGEHWHSTNRQPGRAAAGDIGSGCILRNLQHKAKFPSDSRGYGGRRCVCIFIVTTAIVYGGPDSPEHQANQEDRCVLATTDNKRAGLQLWCTNAFGRFDWSDETDGAWIGTSDSRRTSTTIGSGTHTASGWWHNTSIVSQSHASNGGRITFDRTASSTDAGGAERYHATRRRYRADRQQLSTAGHRGVHTNSSYQWQ